MPRNLDDLESHAEKFWPKELSQREKNSSIIPRLIESQEKFIAILYVADASPTSWQDVLSKTQGMPGNFFLKHLIVLSDVGGEMLQRFHSNINKFFPTGVMTFRWKNSRHRYKFRSNKAAGATWNNTKLKVDGIGLSMPSDMSPAMEDVAMILLHGGASIDPAIPKDMPEKCILGSLIGQKEDLDTFVRQRYICVSRIVVGAKANTLGQLCQSYVKERLKNALPTWNFSRHTITGISHNEGRTDMSFDLVAQSPAEKCCAIEVSFQVTTNSVIERKAGQADARQRILHQAGHKIAYVIDGAGNFNRRSALRTICAHSDCTVTFKDFELDKLVNFLRTM